MSNKTQRCPLCGAKGAVHEARRTEYTYKEEKFYINQPALWCDRCDDAVITPADNKASLKDMATARAVIDKVLTPDEVRKARKKLGWTQEQAGEYFGGGPSAFGKYERGEIQIPKTVSVLLYTLSTNKALLDSIEKSLNSIIKEHDVFLDEHGEYFINTKKAG
ncbi:type II toxin-antitoxin system MqsA family antitoxin [Piscirickettsia litoralis]|nr:type II toxin-antitoxin system MqsA family antitoxin [Piscirickettsia litoralis]